MPGQTGPKVGATHGPACPGHGFAVLVLMTWLTRGYTDGQDYGDK